MASLADVIGTSWRDAPGAAPIYMRLQAALRDAVAAGGLQAGDALPAERDLATLFGISRVTVRKALSGLAAEGLLVPRRGAGTFIGSKPRQVEQPLSRLTSFSEEMRARGMRPATRVLDSTISLPSSSEAMTLGITLGEKVCRIYRLRFADDVPMALEMSSLPQALLADPSEVNESLYAVLRARGIRPARAMQRIRAVSLGAVEAEHLGIAAGAPALKIERISYLADGRVVEFTRSFYRGDAYDFVAELNPGKDP
ncbi:GntR family transcriptional regulator [Oryzibacter oryziterrae]|uniref:GntR family transcriptional regulator n=1 Tax=Oryzibacter oryziterrae TaxID=2766474 RepID=UPI001F3E41DA|nr:GntR family transcriptional regulator [Oryzibacter oryziterrae]